MLYNNQLKCLYWVCVSNELTEPFLHMGWEWENIFPKSWLLWPLKDSPSQLREGKTSWCIYLKTLETISWLITLSDIEIKVTCVAVLGESLLLKYVSKASFNSQPGSLIYSELAEPFGSIILSGSNPKALCDQMSCVIKEMERLQFLLNGSPKTRKARENVVCVN